MKRLINHIIRLSGENRVAPKQAQKQLERARKDWFEVFRVTREDDYSKGLKFHMV